MKKQYQKPALDTFRLEPGAYLETITMSGGGSTEETPGELDAKSREDEEAYVATGGAGASSYGDLW